MKPQLLFYVWVVCMHGVAAFCSVFFFKNNIKSEGFWIAQLFLAVFIVACCVNE